MICAFLLLSVSLIAKRSDGSNIYMSWKFKTDELEINCTVSKLDHELSIFGPSGKLEAHCLPPVHSSCCNSYITKGHIDQNLVTNTTLFTLYDTEISKFNGKWMCLHGQFPDVASIEVTVLEVVKYKTKDQPCYEKFVTWTMIGFFPTFIILRILVWRVTWISGVKEKVTNTLLASCTCIGPHKSVSAIVCRRILIIVISFYLFMMPFIIGLLEKTKCKAPELFSLAGVICGLLINIVWSENEHVNELPTNGVHNIPMIQVTERD